MTYKNPADTPAIRKHTSDNPTTCPWCGQNTWFVSDSDDPRDNGRVQMYCDAVGCESRETELLIVRGEGANFRADVRALNMVDDGHHAGDAPSPSTITLFDPATEARFAHKDAHRVTWRHSEEPFTIRPGDEHDA